MGKKRAVLYLVAGLVCAAVAIMVLKKQQSAPSNKGNVETTKVFVARALITFGTPLTVYDAGTKQGNVCPVNWPKDFVPEGAITDPKELSEEELVAKSSLVRYEPIIKGKTVPKARLIPEGMITFKLKVKPEDVEQYKAGDYVDLIVYGADKRAREFAKCLRIYAIGKLHWLEDSRKTGDKGKKEVLPPVLYLLARAQDRLKLIEAEKRYQLIVFPVPAGRECEAGPLVVAMVNKDPVKAPPKPAPVDPRPAEKTPSELLLAARSRIEAAGQSDWPQSAKELDAARGLLVKITTSHPNTIKEYKEAQSLLKDIDASGHKLKLEHNWSEHEKAIKTAIRGGDFPRCQKLLTQARSDYEELGKDVLDKVLVYSNDVENRRRDCQSTYTLFSNLLKNNVKGKALETYAELKKKFPESRETVLAQKMLKERGMLK